MEFLLGNVHGTRYMARCVFEGSPIVNDEEFVLPFHQPFELPDIDVSDAVDEEATGRKKTGDDERQEGENGQGMS